MRKILLSAGVFFGSFAMMAAANAVTYSGAINSNGTQQVHSAKYSVSHPSTGRYILTFTKPVTPAASCLFQANGSNVIVNGLGESSTVCDVTFANASTLAPTDVLFEFIAVNFTN